MLSLSMFLLVKITLMIVLAAVITNYVLLVFFSITISADSNRVPYDLPEAESEPVAGFITEYSSLYFSLILLTEYSNVIALSYIIIFCFPLHPLPLVFILSTTSLIRSTLCRLKYDELMSTA